jgi:hypothetical protein
MTSRPCCFISSLFASMPPVVPVVQRTAGKWG